MKGHRSQFGWALLSFFWLLAPAPALAFGDCPMVGALEGFDASQEPQITHFNSREVEVSDAKGSQRVVEKGEVCRQAYDLKPGLTPLSALEIMRNYAEGLPAQGFAIANKGRDDGGDVFAVGKNNGHEYWAHVWQVNGNVVYVETISVAPFRSSALPHGGFDCPIVPALANFGASEAPTILNFNSMELRVVDGDEEKTITKKGKVCKQSYDLKNGIPPASALDIMQNYADALPKLGMTITNTKRDENGDVFATMTKDGVETWAKVWQVNGNVVYVQTLNVAPFQSIVLPHTDSDCPFASAIKDFSASEAPTILNFNSMELRVVDGDEEKTITKKGKVCKQSYDLKAGAPARSALEIMQNYADALPKLGMTITNTKRDENGDVFATMTKDGVETWAKVWQVNGNVVYVQTLNVAPFQSIVLPHTDSDCPFASAIKDFSASEAPTILNFNSMELRVTEGDEEKTITKKGKVCKQSYDLKAGAPARSALEIMQNYADALPKLGMTITNTKRDENGDVFASMTKDGVETWAKVWQVNGNVVYVQTLQIEPFKSSMKAPQAAAQTSPPPAKARFDATAAQDGKPVAGAWCGAFAPGATGRPIVHADSGKWQEIAPGTYDIGCFVVECGAKSEGWLRGQTLAAGDATLSVDTPAPRVAVALELQAPASAVEPVVAESGDFPYLPPAPGSTALGGKALVQPFYVQPADAKQPELVAEKSIEKDYRAPQCVTPGALGAGYADALQKSGWTIVNQTNDPDLRLTAHFGSNGRNIWASVGANASGYALTVADATVTGAKIAEDLNAKCHLALTGVLFDFAKSTLKPEIRRDPRQSRRGACGEPGAEARGRGPHRQRRLGRLQRQAVDGAGEVGRQMARGPRRRRQTPQGPRLRQDAADRRQRHRRGPRQESARRVGESRLQGQERLNGAAEPLQPGLVSGA